jgi:Rps23 Pro-64 3,4-dihydroxylase Tpa1-like proline 4-hydroxylase
MKCKNIECLNETIGKKIYCSLSCRNYYVNKYIRDYTKISETLKGIYIGKYLPGKCKLEECSNDIPYENRESEYCSKECSKKTINKNRKGIKYNHSEEGLRNLRISALKNFHSTNITKRIVEIETYNESPILCKNCLSKIEYIKRNRLFCSPDCRRDFRRKDMDTFKIYKAETNFKFNLADYPDKFDFSLIEKYGWYSPSNKNNNLGGVSRDHMLSVKEGFELGIDPKLLSHPANCKLMIHNDNVSKNKKSSITLEELLERIENFNKK